MLKSLDERRAIGVCENRKRGSRPEGRHFLNYIELAILRLPRRFFSRIASGFCRALPSRFAGEAGGGGGDRGARRRRDARYRDRTTQPNATLTQPARSCTCASLARSRSVTLSRTPTNQARLQPHTHTQQDQEKPTTAHHISQQRGARYTTHTQTALLHLRVRR